MKQTDLFEKIIVDNFAGGGGASTGIELACGRPVTIAINHDPDAILLHRTNHPYTEHLQASVWDVDPEQVVRGRKVGLAWFSPDCKHFSKAKGAALVDRNIRGLAWIALRWAGTVRPDVILLENVEEFVTWGPVRKGKPVKSKAGQTFRKWKQQLEELGYTVEYRVLVAADYGAPTTRKRFVLAARCDGRPIVWPERTHAPRNSPETKAGRLKPWRSAAEIIDWSIPGYSIFQSKEEIKQKYGVTVVRPLAENTLRRVIRGVDKFTLRSGEPFLVPTGYGEKNGQAPRVHDINEPVPTVVGAGKHQLADPLLAPFTATNTSNSVGAPACDPVHTVTTAGNQMLITPHLVECNHSGGGHIADAREPYKTITAKHTGGIVAANLIQYHTEQAENVRANGLEKPINTVDASNRYGLVAANLVEYYTGGRPLDISAPMHTVTSHDREAMVAAQIAEFKGQDIGQDCRKPLRTVTAGGGEFGVVRVTLRQDGNMGYWPQVRELLNRFCGYDLGDKECLVLMIGGVGYYIADITLRMLTPRELYNAMGFPPDYKIERDYLGNAYPKSKQVARCGNAVCPPLAEAMVRANLPEWCGEKITTMERLGEVQTA
ncbi:MAG: DNA cytosine methyltransferase [Eubacteriales bacterium]|nr:DNA cytosine methyltransferase [Eubacteriales bacterium]